MEGFEVSAKKRPGWVWVIFIFLCFSAGWTLLSFYLIRSGAIPLNASQVAYLDSLTALDYVSTVGVALVNMTAAVALFLLRKASFYLFASALGANVLLTIWHAATKGWGAAIGGPGFVGALIGLGIMFAVCAYSWRLIQRGVLR